MPGQRTGSGPSSADVPLRKGRRRDPPRGETVTYVTLVGTGGKAGASGSFLGHFVEVGCRFRCRRDVGEEESRSSVEFL